jgi:hypothetical protein
MLAYGIMCSLYLRPKLGFLPLWDTVSGKTSQRTSIILSQVSRDELTGAQDKEIPGCAKDPEIRKTMTFLEVTDYFM